MRIAFGIVLTAVAWLMLGGCSPPNETKKEAAAHAKSETAPDIFRANLDTSKGPVVIEAHRDWAPAGADHLYNLVKTGFYDGVRFFRVTRNYVQFGISGDPQTNRLWAGASLPDDPVRHSNVRGTVTYAHLGPNSRTTQLFFNRKDNQDLDKQGFAPVGQVISGWDVVDSLYGSYGEMAPRGQGPDPTKIQQQGNEYLDNRFPRLDYIRKATIQ